MEEPQPGNTRHHEPPTPGEASTTIQQDTPTWSNGSTWRSLNNHTAGHPDLEQWQHLE